MIRRYRELMLIPTFEERYHYLKLGSRIGDKTFGSARDLNQDFYRSTEWKHVRRDVIARDMGCDLGIEGYEIFSNIHVHHMNPMSIEDVLDHNPDNLNPEFLITVTQNTHNAIHFGDERLLPTVLVERRPGDTTPWK